MSYFESSSTDSSGEVFQVDNNEAGFKQLAARFKKSPLSLIVMEATGGYEKDAAAYFCNVSLPVAVVNPRQVRDFAKATGTLAKTESLDAASIAHFAEAIEPKIMVAKSSAVEELEELLRRRKQLVRARKGSA